MDFPQVYFYSQPKQDAELNHQLAQLDPPIDAQMMSLHHFPINGAPNMVINHYVNRQAHKYEHSCHIGESLRYIALRPCHVNAETRTDHFCVAGSIQ